MSNITEIASSTLEVIDGWIFGSAPINDAEKEKVSTEQETAPEKEPEVAQDKKTNVFDLAAQAPEKKEEKKIEEQKIAVASTDEDEDLEDIIDEIEEVKLDSVSTIQTSKEDEKKIEAIVPKEEVKNPKVEVRFEEKKHIEETHKEPVKQPVEQNAAELKPVRIERKTKNHVEYSYPVQGLKEASVKELPGSKKKEK